MQAAAATRVRFVGALILREARTRFGRAQLGYLWASAEPIAMVATFSLLSVALGHLPPYGDSLPMFFALGTLAFLFYRRVVQFCASAFDANQALLNYPIVKQIDTLLARALLEVATCLFTAGLILAVIVVAMRQPMPVHLEAMAAGIALLVLLGFGQGTINAVIGSYFTSWRQIEAVISRPMFVLSGVFFVPDRMPPKVVSYLAWNPVVHGIEMVRYGYYPDYRSPTLDVGYLFFWALGLTVVGLAAERAMRIRSAGGGGGA